MGPRSRVMSQDQVCGARGHQLGLGVAGMTALIAPLSHRLVRGQDPVHRALGAQIPAFIEQRRDDLGR